jgi:hypothetical protein
MKPLCFNELIWNQHCSAVNHGKMLQIHKTTHLYGVPQRFVLVKVSVQTGVCLAYNQACTNSGQQIAMASKIFMMGLKLSSVMLLLGARIVQSV